MAAWREMNAQAPRAAAHGRGGKADAITYKTNLSLEEAIQILNVDKKLDLQQVIKVNSRS